VWGVVLKHSSAGDVVSRWDMLDVRARPTSLAARFPDGLVESMPFPFAAPQVDTGSEFTAEVEQACQQGLPLFVLPPLAPN
jgi:hypothetical protein